MEAGPVPSTKPVLVRCDGSEQTLFKATAVPMEAGDRLIFRSAGGGGWGDPRLRSREAIADDVAKGLISPDAARRDYGFEARDTAAE
jgi:N-methylhydantoinase B